MRGTVVCVYIYIYTDLCYNEYLFTGNCGWGRVERSSMVVLSSLVVPLGLGTWDARVMCFFAFMPALSAVISLNSDDPLVPRSLCREGGALAHPFKSHLPNPFRRGPLPFQAFLKGFSTSHLQVRAEPSLPVPAAPEDSAAGCASIVGRASAAWSTFGRAAGDIRSPSGSAQALVVPRRIPCYI